MGAENQNYEISYRRLGRLIEIAPNTPQSAELSPDLMKWLGQVSAAIRETDDLALLVEVNSAISGLQYPNRAEYFQNILIALYKALATAELKAPESAQGAFIAVGNAFDAFSAITKIFSRAEKDILIVDPYMDETVITEFAASAPEHISFRLLTDEATAKPSLSPAGAKWNQQHSSRQLQIRLAQPRTLHDRAIFVDRLNAWIVTQSLKDLAKRSPAEIVRGDDTAALKIAAYESLWSTSKTLV